MLNISIKFFNKTLVTVGLLFLAISAYAGNISGTVLDSESKPIPGVTIRIGGTTKGAVTKDNGSFEIKSVAAGKYTLIVSFVGYKTITQSIVVGRTQRLNLDFTLEEDVSALGSVCLLYTSDAADEYRGVDHRGCRITTKKKKEYLHRETKR